MRLLVNIYRFKRWRASKTACWVAGLLFTLTSCGSENSVSVAQRGVNKFRSQVDSQQYSAIYDGADASLRQKLPSGKFVEFLQMISSKMGKAEKSHLRSEQHSWFVGQGERVVLVYDTKFSGGLASEQFVWHVRGSSALLVGYYVNTEKARPEFH